MSANSPTVDIVDYLPQYGKAFRDLNEEWISKYFTMEPADYKSLEHPQEYFVDRGGHVFIALADGVPVGTSALIKKEDGTFEVAKMSVSPTAQGLGIAKKLMQALISKAKELQGKRLYIESNRRLTPAISLYCKFGFNEIQGSSPYERCDIFLELLL
jgi:GNAT superfamily N-acetyltransferase